MGFLNMKTILISAGILSMAMGLKLSFPIITHFIISELVPSISSFFYTSLTPPYLYILLNFIILTILASSKFHTEPVLYTTTVQPEPVKITQTDYNNNVYNGVVSDAPFYNSETTPLSIDTVVNVNGNDRYVYDVDLPEETTVNNVVSGSEAYQPETAPLRDDAVMNSDGYLYDGHAPVETTVASGNDAVATPYLHKKEPLKFSNDENEKPPFSARFSQRKAVRTTPEGGKVVALGVAKSKKHDTLESTWKTITEGRAMPLTRHLKKSETWEQQNRRNATPFTDLNGGDGGGGKAMKKSETFSGRENKNTVSSSPGSGGKLRKESSLSQDELHRRVEAFIKKFNTEMRLQRQESLRQYSNMIDSGAQ